MAVHGHSRFYAGVINPRIYMVTYIVETSENILTCTASSDLWSAFRRLSCACASIASGMRSFASSFAHILSYGLSTHKRRRVEEEPNISVSGVDKPTHPLTPRQTTLDGDSQVQQVTGCAIGEPRCHGRVCDDKRTDFVCFPGPACHHDSPSLKLAGPRLNAPPEPSQISAWYQRWRYELKGCKTAQPTSPNTGERSVCLPATRYPPAAGDHVQAPLDKENVMPFAGPVSFDGYGWPPVR